MKDGATIYFFRFTLRHDNGCIRIITTGRSPQAARRKIILAEGCPASAIIKEEIQDKGKFVSLL
jgi:hypothetical protein